MILLYTVSRYAFIQFYTYKQLCRCGAMPAPLCASAEPGEAWVQAVLIAHNERRSAHWTPPLATQLHNYMTFRSGREQKLRIY